MPLCVFNTLYLRVCMHSRSIYVCIRLFIPRHACTCPISIVCMCVYVCVCTCIHVCDAVLQISVGGGLRPSHPDGYAISFALVGDATMFAHIQGPSSKLYTTCACIYLCMCVCFALVGGATMFLVHFQGPGSKLYIHHTSTCICLCLVCIFCSGWRSYNVCLLVISCNATYLVYVRCVCIRTCTSAYDIGCRGVRLLLQIYASRDGHIHTYVCLLL
jgi:hypothetical protein